MIRKLPSGKYRLYSRKVNPKTGRRRNLGTFDSRAGGKARTRGAVFQTALMIFSRARLMFRKDVIAGLVPAISIPVAGHRKRRALGMPRSLTSRSGAA